jgi:hypothetical protein
VDTLRATSQTIFHIFLGSYLHSRHLQGMADFTSANEMVDTYNRYENTVLIRALCHKLRYKLQQLAFLTKAKIRDFWGTVCPRERF